MTLTSCPPESVCICVGYTHTQAHTPLVDSVHARAHTCSPISIFKCIYVGLHTIYTCTHGYIHSGLIALWWVCTQAHIHLRDPGHADPRTETGRPPPQGWMSLFGVTHTFLYWRIQHTQEYAPPCTHVYWGTSVRHRNTRIQGQQWLAAGSRVTCMGMCTPHP